MKISLVYSPAARQVREWLIDVPPGSTVLQAVASSGLISEFPELDLEQLTLGVWAKQVQPGDLLSDGDRIEAYRSLQVDPKVARRERFRSQGVRSAGLFAKKRAGSKAGY